MPPGRPGSLRGRTRVGPPFRALTAGTNEFTPENFRITVPVIAPFAGDETVPYDLHGARPHVVIRAVHRIASVAVPPR